MGYHGTLGTFSTLQDAQSQWHIRLLILGRVMINQFCLWYSCAYQMLSLAPIIVCYQLLFSNATSGNNSVKCNINMWTGKLLLFIAWPQTGHQPCIYWHLGWEHWTFHVPQGARKHCWDFIRVWGGWETRAVFGAVRYYLCSLNVFSRHNIGRVGL